MIRQYLEDLKKNQLYKNSYFLTLSRFINVGFGFIFWIIAAKFYSVEDVGIAAALLSSVNIITSFSRFGFDYSLIRFIKKDKTIVFNTCLTITTISTILIGILYILGIKFFASSLAFIQNPNYALIFIIFTLMNSIGLIIGVAFTAIRETNYYLYQNILLALRVPLLIPLIYLGSFGIFVSVGLAFILSTVFAYIYLNRFLRFGFKIDKKFIKESFVFSSGNYLSNIFSQIPVLILPIMVLSLLGEKEAAHYYIAFAIGSIVSIIPESISISLFIEGSHGENLKKNAIKAGVAIYSILIPAVIFVYIFGANFLAMVGKDYIESVELLRVLTISSMFVALFSIFISIQNVRLNIKSIIKMNFLIFLLLPALTYLCVSRFGIVGIGYAWIIAYGIVDLIILITIKNAGWITFDSRSQV